MVAPCGENSIIRLRISPRSFEAATFPITPAQATKKKIARIKIVLFGIYGMRTSLIVRVFLWLTLVAICVR